MAFPNPGTSAPRCQWLSWCELGHPSPLLVAQFLLYETFAGNLKHTKSQTSCLQQPLLSPTEQKLGKRRQEQQEGTMSKGGKSRPGHAGNSQMPGWWCLSMKPPDSDSSLQGSWVVTQPRRRRRRMCGASLLCPPAVTVAAHTRMAGAFCPAGIYSCPKAPSLFGSSVV